MSDVSVQGVAQLERKLTRLAQAATPRQLEAAVRAGLLLVEVDAKRLAPVLTGALRSSIHTETQGGRDGATGRTGTNLEYGPFVEFGTYRQRPQPYLRPAFDQRRDAALREVAGALRELVRP